MLPGSRWLRPSPSSCAKGSARLSTCHVPTLPPTPTVGTAPDLSLTDTPPHHNRRKGPRPATNRHFAALLAENGSGARDHQRRRDRGRALTASGEA